MLRSSASSMPVKLGVTSTVPGTQIDCVDGAVRQRVSHPDAVEALLAGSSEALALPFGSTGGSMGSSKRFVFRIKTKSGGIVGNIAIDAKDRADAENQLRKKYPECTILNAEAR